MAYVDGFLLPVPTAKLDEYQAIAREAGAIWKELGAIDYVECVADDVPHGELTSFPRAVIATDAETVVFSWISYRSREDRDRIVEQVMADPRIQAMMSAMPVDGKRMIFGGFRTIVELLDR